MISGADLWTLFSLGDGLVSRGACYRRRERILFNKADFAGVWFLLRLIPFFFFSSLHCHVKKIAHNLCCFAKLSGFCG